MKTIMSCAMPLQYRERTTRFAGKRFGSLAAIAGAALLAVSLSACSSDRTTGISSPALGDNTIGSSTSVPGNQVTFPTIQELTTALNLTPQQVAVVNAALQRFQQEVGLDEETGESGHGHGRGHGHGNGNGHGRGQGHGQGQGNMRHGNGHDQEETETEISPQSVLNFLGDVSAVLSPEQFTLLVQFLMERMPVFLQAINMQPFMTQEMLHRFAQQNNLTPPQFNALLQAVQTSIQAFATFRMQVLQGTISGDMIRTQAGVIRDQFLQSVRNILGDQLFSQFTAFVSQVRIQIATRLLQNLGSQTNSELQILTRTLMLNSQQQMQIRLALQTAISGWTTLLTQLQQANVNMSFEDVVIEAAQISLTLNSSIRSVLTPDQLARFNAALLLFNQPFGIMFI